MSDKKKKDYKKPEVKSEKILEAGLMASCNGTVGGPDNFKASKKDGCSTKKT